MTSARSRLNDILLPPLGQDTTVSTEHSATVTIKLRNLRDFSQNDRSNSQYPEAPNAEANAGTMKTSGESPFIGDSPTSLRSGTNNKGEKIVNTLRPPTSKIKSTAFAGVVSVRSRRDMTNEVA